MRTIFENKSESDRCFEYILVFFFFFVVPKSYHLVYWIGEITNQLFDTNRFVPLFIFSKLSDHITIHTAVTFGTDSDSPRLSSYFQSVAVSNCHIQFNGFSVASVLCQWVLNQEVTVCISQLSWQQPFQSPVMGAALLKATRFASSTENVTQKGKKPDDQTGWNHFKPLYLEVKLKVRTPEMSIITARRTGKLCAHSYGHYFGYSWRLCYKSFSQLDAVITSVKYKMFSV